MLRSVLRHVSASFSALYFSLLTLPLSSPFLPSFCCCFTCSHLFSSSSSFSQPLLPVGTSETVKVHVCHTRVIYDPDAHRPTPVPHLMTSFSTSSRHTHKHKLIDKVKQEITCHFSVQLLGMLMIPTCYSLLLILQTSPSLQLFCFLFPYL